MPSLSPSSSVEPGSVDASRTHEAGRGSASGAGAALLAETPWILTAAQADELRGFGRVLLQFTRAASLLYRQSAEGKQPRWIADQLDHGLPPEWVELQRDPGFKHELPRLLGAEFRWTSRGLTLTELDAAPADVATAAWVSHALRPSPPCATPGGSRSAALPQTPSSVQRHPDPLETPTVLLADWMSAFAPARRIVVLVPAAHPHASTLRWLVRRPPPAGDPSETSGTDAPVPGVDSRSQPAAPWVVEETEAFEAFEPGDGVWWTGNLLDLMRLKGWARLRELVRQKALRLAWPPRPHLHDPTLFALLRNRNLHGFWRLNLGDGFLRRMLAGTVETWRVDPTPLPPQAAWPGLDAVDFRQLPAASTAGCVLTLRPVHGVDPSGSETLILEAAGLPSPEWQAAMARACADFGRRPWVLGRHPAPALATLALGGRAGEPPRTVTGAMRLRAYYAVTGEGDAARARLIGTWVRLTPLAGRIAPPAESSASEDGGGSEVWTVGGVEVA